MAIGYNVLLRNARLDALTTFAGPGAKLRLYNGARPATGGAATTLLAEFTLGSPFAPAASAGALAPTLPSNTTGITDGTATWFRIVKSDNTQVCDGSVAVSGSDLNINSTSVLTGVTLSVTGWGTTTGNS